MLAGRSVVLSSLSGALSLTQQFRFMSMKHKIPKKRASSLLGDLQRKEFEKLKGKRERPDFKAGDSIQVDHLPYMSSNDPTKMRGVVISRTNKQSDSSVTLLNTDHGTPYFRRIFLYSPLVTNVKVLQKAFIKNGKKRVKRAKLYYLKDRKPDSYTVN